MGKQKMVVKFSMVDEKMRSKAMKTAVSFLGVISVEVQGEAKDRIMVIGDGVDSVNLTKTLRRKMGCHVDLLSVGEVVLDQKSNSKDEYQENNKDIDHDKEELVVIGWPSDEYRYDHVPPPPSVFDYYPHLDHHNYTTYI